MNPLNLEVALTKNVHFLDGRLSLDQMYPPVATRDPAAVQAEAQAACIAMFPACDRSLVPQAFDWAIQAFTGHYGDYRPVDAHYHDLEHTLQGTLCFVRLLRARQRAGGQPPLTLRAFQLGLVAILFHDTGYLKKKDDTEGTGAKYTVTHVARSADFAAELLKKKGFNDADIHAVQNMILCTGVDAHLNMIPFQNQLERVVGCSLATADLLGQMAAEDYVQKLPILYGEFAEAVRYSRNTGHFIASFSSAADLMQKTPGFWEDYVLTKLSNDFGGLYHFLSEPYPGGPNTYLMQIGANMERIRSETGKRVKEKQLR